MINRAKVIKGLKKCSIDDVDCKHCPYNGEGNQKYGCETVMQRDALKLLKEQEEQKWAWLQSIADNQLANSPMGHEDEGQLRYKSGLWNGLQMAYKIITAGEKKDG